MVSIKRFLAFSLYLKNYLRYVLYKNFIIKLPLFISANINF
jgi:hypothetical protein